MRYMYSVKGEGNVILETLSKQSKKADGIYKDEEGFFSLLLVITFCCFMVNLRFILMTMLSVFSQEQAVSTSTL